MKNKSWSVSIKVIVASIAISLVSSAFAVNIRTNQGTSSHTNTEQQGMFLYQSPSGAHQLNNMQIHEQGSGGIRARYMDTTSSVQTIRNEQRGHIADCPTITNCSDVKGRRARAGVDTCPDNCKVHRRVYGNANKPYRVDDAVCPSGYYMTSFYNMQPEYYWDNTDLPRLYPVYAVHQPYLALWGYDTSIDCGPAGSMQQSRGIKTSGHGYCPNMTRRSPSTSTPIFDPFIHSYFLVYVRGVIQHHRSCKGSCYGCSSGVVHDNSYRYNYQWVQCDRNPSLRKTGNRIPASIICTRVKSQWRSLE
jgi:hypothetical protein